MLLFLVSRWPHTRAPARRGTEKKTLSLSHKATVERSKMKHFMVITFYPPHIFTIPRIKIEFISVIKIILTIIAEFFLFLNSNFTRRSIDSYN